MPGNGVLELRIKASDPGVMPFIAPDRPEDTAAGILPVRVRLDSPSARYLMGLSIGSEVTMRSGDAVMTEIYNRTSPYCDNGGSDSVALQ